MRLVRAADGIHACLQPDAGCARRTFGPVLCVIPYRDEAEAIAIVNDTNYGLQAYVLSPDVDHAKQVAAQLQAGRVVINGASHVPLAPFGGFKQSGI
jgi:aldehyde dehydrogenase (NAD+)